MKLIRYSLALVALSSMVATDALACTVIAAGKKATADGCVAAAEVGSVVERWALVQRAVAEEWLPPPRAIARQFRAEARVSGAGMPERR